MTDYSHLNYSKETLRLLRNTRFLDEGELDGKCFIRCIPPREFGRELSAEERRAVVLRAIAEINEPGLAVASNPNFGGDYLRVETDTKTYQLIGWMQS